MELSYDISETEPFSVDGVQFVPGFDRPSRPGSFTLQKSPSLLEGYRRFAAEFHGARIFELGIAQGGSVALLTLLAEPARLVSVELNAEPVLPLIQLLEERGLQDRISPHFGVDQSDQRRLRQIVDEGFGDDDLDLVIDDASHLYWPTLASFEVLFPRLRPGGRYLIEDWSWLHLLNRSLENMLADATDPANAAVRQELGEAYVEKGVEPPLSRIAVEAVLARAISGDVVVDVSVSGNWIDITRGPAPLDRDTFRFADHYHDYSGFLRQS